MRHHGILIVRDEADIIGECLRHLTGWCHAVHVYDTGSTDATWDIVREMARSDERVRPVAREEVICDPDLKGYVFERVRHTFEHGDWVSRLDADEFYHEPPPAWIQEHVRPYEGRVFAQDYQFVMTHAELAAWERGEETLADRARPVEQRRRRFVIEPVVEARFFRFRRGMRWSPDQPNPWQPGLPALSRIPIRHYRWRDPEQMKQRCALRVMMDKISIHGVHWKKEWHEWLWDENDPRLMTWEPGTPLPHRSDTNHLGSWGKRLGQGVLYRSGLPRLLDLTRKGWPEGRTPRPMPARTSAATG